MLNRENIYVLDMLSSTKHEYWIHLKPQGELRYEVIGVGVAPAFFAVNIETGAVLLTDTTALSFDRGSSYTVSFWTLFPLLVKEDA